MGGITSSNSVNIGDLIGDGVQGSVIFLGASGALEQDNANLFYDATNARLGIITSAPKASLNVAGTIQTTGQDASVGAGGGLEFAYTGSNGLIVARDSGGAYKPLKIQTPVPGPGTGAGRVYIGGDNPTFATPHVYLDGRNDLAGSDGIFFDASGGSSFRFQQGGILVSSNTALLEWTNTTAGAAGQVWSLRTLPGGAGVFFENLTSLHVAWQVNSTPATGVINSVQIGRKFYPPQDSGALQANAALYAGNGAPGAGTGANGDFYFRGDTAASPHIYKRIGGAWTVIV